MLIVQLLQNPAPLDVHQVHNYNMDILNELNKKQREAAQIIDGPILVFAGPGSGKTRVLTHRIAHLISKGGKAI